MLIDGRQIPERDRLRADVCIIGAGAAGITIANELLGSGLEVILLQAGGLRLEKSSQEIYDGESTAAHIHAPPSMYRQRRLGGSTTIWGGRCVPLDELDFEARDWVPRSGWPFSRAHMKRYYERAMAYCEAGAFEFNEDAIQPFKPYIGGFASSAVTTSVLERFSAPTDFGKRYRASLFRARNIRLITHAACSELIASRDSTTVLYAQGRTSSGMSFHLAAKVFVIAVGGLETVRLLVCSNSVRSAGLGNSDDQVGRYYMCISRARWAGWRLDPPHRQVAWGFERTGDGVYIKRRLQLAEHMQRQKRLLNMIFRLHHAFPADLTHRDAVLSAMYLVKHFMIPEYRRKVAMVEYAYEAGTASRGPLLAEHVANLIRGMPKLIRFEADWGLPPPPSVPTRDFFSAPESCRTISSGLQFRAGAKPEQPGRLSAKRDRLGMPQIRVDRRMAEQDVISIVESYRVLNHEIEAKRVGRLEFGGQDLEEVAHRSVPVGGIPSALLACPKSRALVLLTQYVGCTRGRTSTSQEVPSLPTCGNANPTLTIIALAIRIADPPEG